MPAQIGQSRVQAALSRYFLPLLALALIIVFSLLIPRTFPTPTTVQAILDSIAITAILALAETLVVIIGEFDLSVGYLVGFLHILCIGLMVKQNLSWVAAVMIVLVVGVVFGAFNGILVNVFKIDSFIATLGSGTIAFALANWYTGGEQIFGTLPPAFTAIYSARILGIPIAAFYVVILALIIWFVLDYTTVGRRLYALGSNRRAAELTGVSSRRIIVGTYIAAGLIVAIGAVLLASRLRVGSVSTGPDYLLPVFVGAILGSTTIKPGRPNAWGTVVAVILLGIGIAGLQQLGVQFFVVPLFNGVTLILGVGLAGYAARRARRVRRTVIDATAEATVPDKAEPPIAAPRP